MLVLSRKRREYILIGGSETFDRPVRVLVLEIARGVVKLGFEVDAPVFRAELGKPGGGEAIGFENPSMPLTH